MEKMEKDLFTDKTVESNELAEGGGVTWCAGTCRPANGGCAHTDEVADGAQAA